MREFRPRCRSFTVIHQVLPQNCASSVRKIYSQITLVQLCGIALTPVSLYFLVWRRLPTCDRSEIGKRQSGYRSVSFSAFSQFTDSVLLHIRFTLRRRNKQSCATRLRVVTDGTYEFHLFVNSYLLTPNSYLLFEFSLPLPRTDTRRTARSMRGSCSRSPASAQCRQRNPSRNPSSADPSRPGCSAPCRTR